MTGSDEPARPQGAAAASDQEALTEQIKLLVKTEQRLYRSQNELDRQLRRIEALSEFAIAGTAMDAPQQVIRRALDLLASQFRLNCLGAVLVDPVRNVLEGLTCEPGLGPASPWREVDERVRQWFDAHDGPALIRPADFEHVPAPVRAALCAPAPGVDPNAVGVCIPLRQDHDTFLGGIVAGGPPPLRPGAYQRVVPGPEHLPYLRLIAAHLERALLNARLTGDLTRHGEQLVRANERLNESLTRLQTAQQQLIQAQKLEAIGRLAGGVAHDFNNMLTVIMSHADVIRARHPAGSTDHDDAAQILEASTRAARITSQLLAFGRKQPQQRVSVDPNRLISEMVRMLGRLIGEHVALELELAPDIGAVWGDPAMLQQVVLNLVLNARDAMPEGGRIMIGTRAPGVDDERLTGRSLPAADFMVIFVRDTGHGMDERTRAHVFEPFFTTKPTGRGTGLGLSTVYGIVTQSGGHVYTTSAPGAGACFTVVLPRSGTGGDGGDEEAPIERRRGRSATVLVAEDEASIRDLVRAALERDGFRVLLAQDGAEALRVLERAPAEVDALLTDVVMPHMGGIELARELRRRNPELPVLFMSGYAREAFDEGEAAAATGFVQKPFTPGALIDRLRELLAAGEGEDAAAG